MKRTIGYIYEGICDKENIKKSIICTLKIKKKQKYKEYWRYKKTDL